jgi:hypothetical protein
MQGCLQQLQDEVASSDEVAMAVKPLSMMDSVEVTNLQVTEILQKLEQIQVNLDVQEQYLSEKFNEIASL